ncbi:MAG: metallophosphoesterase [Desulfobacterales bacterium]|nr:metallophosphoesterase [Desulfobacterales bacterium]MBF0397485.1 metallophosphoesterase [Desulfobacterales bacterium]
MNKKIKLLTTFTLIGFLFFSLNVYAGSKPPAPKGFRIYPTLQIVSPTSVGIMWATYNADKGVVTVSAANGMNPSIAPAISTYSTIHKIIVKGLKSNTRYYVQVKADGQTSNVGTFVTAPPKGSRVPIRFVVYGDTRTGHWAENLADSVGIAKYGDDDDHLAVCQSIMNQAPNFIIHVGDYAFSGVDMDKIYGFFNVERDLLSNVPLLPTYGNHEFKGGHNQENTYFSSYFIPVPVANGSFAWYSYDYANVHIITLNAGEGVFATDNFDLIKPGSPQYSFLEADLKKASTDPDIDHIFVSMHNPLYSVANFGDNKTLQNALEPLFRQYGVKAVFTGHEHDYQHTERYGIHHVLTGGGGSPILDLPWKGDQNDTEATLVKYDTILNYMLVDVNGHTLDCSTYKVQGNGSSASSVFERFNL